MYERPFSRSESEGETLNVNVGMIRLMLVFRPRFKNRERAEELKCWNNSVIYTGDFSP